MPVGAVAVRGHSRRGGAIVCYTGPHLRSLGEPPSDWRLRLSDARTARMLQVGFFPAEFGHDLRVFRVSAVFLDEMRRWPPVGKENTAETRKTQRDE